MIKNKIKNILILFIILPVLASCAGTGTKSLSMINLNVDSDETAAFFVENVLLLCRSSKISLDGNEVGKLGVGEIENKYRTRFSTAGSIGNILQAGVGSDAVAFNADEGKAYYFIIDFDQGLFTGKWSITETSKNGFTKALN